MRRRHGSLFIEVTMAVVILAMAFVAIAQLVGFVGYQHRENNRRSLAVRTTGNMIERVMGIPWDQLSQNAIDQFEMSDEDQLDLPDSHLKITVEDLTVSGEAEERAPSAKMITVELSWRNRAGQRVHPIRTRAWKYHHANTEQDE